MAEEKITKSSISIWINQWVKWNGVSFHCNFGVVCSLHFFLKLNWGSLIHSILKYVENYKPYATSQSREGRKQTLDITNKDYGKLKQIWNFLVGTYSCYSHMYLFISWCINWGQSREKHIPIASLKRLQEISKQSYVLSFIPKLH